MRRGIAIISLLLMLPVLSGCGTCLNLRDFNQPKWRSDVPPLTPFGGVQTEVSNVCDTFTRFVHLNRYETVADLLDRLTPGSEIYFATYILCVDLPLTVIADTVTLPYVLAKGPGSPNPPGCVTLPSGLTISADDPYSTEETIDGIHSDPMLNGEPASHREDHNP